MSTKKFLLKRPTIAPEEIDTKDAKKVLDFLNTVKTSKEIADTIEFPSETDVGIKVADNILENRSKLGKFSDLKEIMDIPYIGPERFTDIVSILAGTVDVGEPERINFKYMIAMNPNYFGNLKLSPFEPVKPMHNNTSFEELMCIGFNPQFDRLEAVVHVKKSSGYGGNICSDGSKEFIRFYVDWNNTNDWEDVGMLSFTAYNISSTSKLEYDLSIILDAKKKWCKFENIPKVRAILSWHTPPPPDTPDYTPVWGNSVDARIQIDALKLLFIKEIAKMPDVSIPSEMLELLDLEKKVDMKVPEKLTVPELSQLYKNVDKKVPPHRFGFPQIHKLMGKSGLLPDKTAIADVKVSVAKSPLLELGFDPGDIPSIVDELIPLPFGDTTFEELKCIGLNTNQDVLAGVIELKKPNGYSGNLCSAGSNEYVAFWADWGDGAGWTYAGMTSVNVHDISTIPDEDLQYSVFLPINLNGRRQPCTDGPKLVKIRAILSWGVAPPAWNPNYMPRWGNRRETVVHILPGPAIAEGEHIPYISVVGNMGIDDIDNSNGLATGTGVIAAFTANDSPFGGVVTICGHIAFPPDTFVSGSAGPSKLQYKVFVRRSQPGEPWQQLNNSFNIKLVNQVGSTFYGPYNHKQKIDSNGYYTYMEDLYGNERRFVEGFVLAKWVTSASMNGIWEIRMEAFDPLTSIIYQALNSDGTPQVIKACLDNVWPVPGIDITEYTSNGVSTPAMECDSFRKGDILHGKYSVLDDHFGALTVWVEPTSPANGGKLCIKPGSSLCTAGSTWDTPPIVSRSYPVVPTGGEKGVWSLDTDDMDPCGYIIKVRGHDRTIINSGKIGHYSGKSVGFCLLKPK
ncbi:MAG: hypothetical protein ACT6FD_03500 [Methanosarcinaceae archaeon]